MVSVDRERDDEFERLAGEDPDTPLLEDVEHWVAVYTELLTGASHLRQVVPDGKERFDDELGRMRERLAYWIDRRNRLLDE
jgi:hypothetical protein